jgi:hypothetical protein
MATFKTTTYLTQDQDPTLAPGAKAEVGDLNGRVRCMPFSVDLPADTNTGDVLFCAKIPTGARVIDLHIYVPRLGDGGTPTGIFDAGWGVSLDGTEAEDTNGFGELDAGPAAKDFRLVGGVPGFEKKFTREVDLKLTCTEDAGIATTALVVKGNVFFVLD